MFPSAIFSHTEYHSIADTIEFCPTAVAHFTNNQIIHADSVQSWESLFLLLLKPILVSEGSLQLNLNCFVVIFFFASLTAAGCQPSTIWSCFVYVATTHRLFQRAADAAPGDSRECATAEKKWKELLKVAGKAATAADNLFVCFSLHFLSLWVFMWFRLDGFALPFHIILPTWCCCTGVDWIGGWCLGVDCISWTATNTIDPRLSSFLLVEGIIGEFIGENIEKYFFSSILRLYRLKFYLQRTFMLLLYTFFSSLSLCFNASI